MFWLMFNIYFLKIVVRVGCRDAEHMGVLFLFFIYFLLHLMTSVGKLLFYPGLLFISIKRKDFQSNVLIKTDLCTLITSINGKYYNDKNFIFKVQSALFLFYYHF